jgi:hypothetical protein
MITVKVYVKDDTAKGYSTYSATAKCQALAEAKARRISEARIKRGERVIMAMYELLKPSTEI